MDTNMASAKQSAKSLYSRGFTIVELVVVIVVIAILAAIVIVGYNGVRRSAIEAGLKTDLRNGATQVENERTETGSYPTISYANSNILLKVVSENNTLTFNPTSATYCLVATSSRLPGVSFHIIGSEGKIVDGDCPAVVANVTTIAGSATPGYVNGSGSAVRFNFYNILDDNYGVGIDTDNQGNAYIADHGNNVIRKITPTGTVSVYAGMHGDSGNIESTNALSASFNYPFDLTIFNQGSEEIMLVTEKCLSSIKMSQANNPLTIVNIDTLSPHDGHYECPYLTNSTDSTEYGALFRDANSVVVDKNYTVYMSEYDSTKVRKMTFNTGVSWWDSVTNLTPAGSFAYEARFGIDPQDRVYGSVGNKIVRFTSAGILSDFAGTTASGYTDATGTAARFNNAKGTDVDANGNVYVADCGNHRIRKISPSGVVTTVAGSSTAGNVDGQGTAAQFYCPTDLAITNDGLTLYVVDTVTSGSDIAGYIRRISL